MASETRIPDIPDQSRSLMGWHNLGAPSPNVRFGDDAEISRLSYEEPWGDLNSRGVPATSDELRGSIPQQRDSPLRRLPDAAWMQSPETALNIRNTERRIRFEEADVSRRSIRTSEGIPPRYFGAAPPAIGPEQVQTLRVHTLQQHAQQLTHGLVVLVSEVQHLNTQTPEIDRAITNSRRLEETLVALQRRIAQLHLNTELPSQGFNMSTGPYDLNGDRRTILQQRIDESNSDLERAINSRERAADELEASESEVQATRERTRVLERELDREVRSIENLTRLFGSREEVERQGADYESPIGGMFNRAWGRYRDREEERSREQVLSEVLQAEDFYQIPDSRRMATTLGVNELSIDGSWLHDEHNATSNEHGMVDEPSLPELPSPIGTELLLPTNVSTAATVSSRAELRAERWARRAHRGMSENERDMRGLVRDSERRIRESEQERDRLFSELGRLREARLRRDTRDARDAEGPPPPTRDRTSIPHTSIRHRDTQVQTIHAQRRINQTLRAPYGAATQAHAEDVLDYPPFSGQIQAIDTTNQMLGYRTFNDLLGPGESHPRVATEGLDDGDEDEGYTAEGEGKGLDDENDGRPEPKNQEEMTLVLECKICYDQIADTACLPCGHLAMCQWCAEKHIPSQERDKTRPRKIANCPMCRKRVKQKVMCSVFASMDLRVLTFL